MLALMAALAASADFIFSYFLQDKGVSDKLCVNFPVVAQISSVDPIDPANIKWTVSGDCQVVNEAADKLSVTFSCAATGMNTIDYEITGTEPVKETVTMFFESCNEFHWYARVKGADGTQRLLNNGSDVEIWTVSSGIGDESESSHVAVEPSVSSQNLAHALYISGIEPVLTIMGSDGEVLESARVQKPYYNNEKSRWTATVFFSDWSDMYLNIEPSDHDIAGGNVDVTREVLCPQLVNFDAVMSAIGLVKLASDVNIDMPITLKGSRHPCVQNTACVLAGNSLITTIDDFETIEAWDVEDLGYKSLCLTMNALLILTEKQVIRVMLKSLEKTTPITGTYDRIVAPSSCLTLEDAEVATSSLDWVALYYTTAGKVMLSPDEGVTYFPLEVGTDVAEILDASFLVTGKGTLHLCLRVTGSTTGTHCIRTFDLETRSVKSNFFFNGNTPQLRASDVGHLYLLDTVTRISTDTGETFSQLARGQRSSSTAPADDSHVTDISFSSSGELVVTRSNGVLEYGRLDLNLVVNLQAKASSRSVCRFDSLGRLEIIEFPSFLTTGQRSFPKYLISLKSEKQVAIENLKGQLNVQCPIRQFDTKLPAGRSAYLDLNTELVIETTTLSSNGVYPLTQTSDEVEMEIFRNVVSTVELDPESNFFYSTKRVDQNISLEGLKRGASHMILTVSGSTIACQDSVKILRLLVGCPKNRRLRIKGSDYIRLFYAKTRFRPELELLDGDTHVMDVDADFALYVTRGDEHDETVRYCMTAQDVGCLRKPQTWQDFDVETDWNKSSYQSCFEGPPEAYDEKTPYPILNSTGQNCVIFVPRNQVYQVRAVVLDPEFSYCHLSTEFTVEVWGQPPPWWVTLIIMGLVIVVCFFGVLGMWLYDQHRFKKMHKKKEPKHS